VSKNYISNDDLLKEIIKYKESKVISEELGRMLLAIATNYSTKGNFVGYTWRADMCGDALLTCIKYLNNFDPKKSTNAFGYITQICKNSFKLYIKEQHKHSKIKDMCYNSKDLFKDDTYTQKSVDYEKVLEYYDVTANVEEVNDPLYNDR
jgi:hypothetical protein